MPLVFSILEQMTSLQRCISILKFCEYLGKLKHLPRTGWVLREIPDPESVASHMYRMAMLSFLIKEPGVDVTRCMKMCLVHDLAESIVGDITPHCGIDNETKRQSEQTAMMSLAGLIPEDVGAELVTLWQEYESGETVEAKVVKDLDKFDMIVQAFEYERSLDKPGFLQEFFDSTKDRFQTDQVKHWVQELYEARNSKSE